MKRQHECCRRASALDNSISDGKGTLGRRRSTVCGQHAHGAAQRLPLAAAVTTALVAILGVAAPGRAGAAGIDVLQVVQVQPTGDAVRVLVAVPERFTGRPLASDAFSVEAGGRSIAIRDVTPLSADRSSVVAVLDDRATMAASDLLAAKAATVELVRALESDTPFGLVTAAGALVAHPPSTDRVAASEAISAVTGTAQGDGELADAVGAAVALAGDAPGPGAAAPDVVLFTGGPGGLDAAQLAPVVAAAGGILTVFDTTGAKVVELIPAVDELVGSLTGRYLLTVLSWGSGPATVGLDLEGSVYRATVDLPIETAPTSPSVAPPTVPASAPAGAAGSTVAAPDTAQEAPAAASESGPSVLVVVLVAAGLVAAAAFAAWAWNRDRRRARAVAPLATPVEPSPDPLVSPEPDAAAPATPEPAPGVDAPVTDPAPAVRVSDPAPAVLVSDPAPAVRVSDPAPEVRVSDPAPEVQVSDPLPAAPVPDPVVAAPAVAEHMSKAPVPVIAAVAPRPIVSSRRPAGPNWCELPAIDDLMAWTARGVSPGRTWVVAPTQSALRARWTQLVRAPGPERARLLGGRQRDRVTWVDGRGLPGFPPSPRPLVEETRSAPVPIRYARRSFDRQWLIPDRRVLERPDATLWSIRTAPDQVYLTTVNGPVGSGGPAITATALLPQFNHYNGEPGAVWPLWIDPDGVEPNVVDGVLPFLASRLECEVTGRQLFAYLAAVCAHPGFGRRRAESAPGAPAAGALRVPVTADPALWARALHIGGKVLRLQTLGEHRPAGDVSAGSPLLTPGAKLTAARLESPIPHTAADRPADYSYDADARRLTVGAGVISDVAPEVWSYEVGGMAVVPQWLSQRVPAAAQRRQSRLDQVQPASWEAGWTTELLLVLHALAGLRGLEGAQAELLSAVLEQPLVRADDVSRATRPASAVAT